MPIDNKPYMQLMNYENLMLTKCVYDGPYQIPVIYPVPYEEVEEFVPFTFSLYETHPEEKGVQFFQDDYRFTRVWNQPAKYVERFKKFKVVLSPDFSLFMDFPVVMQMYNHYRKHWCAAYWQENGVNVIPTICWSDKQSIDWCFYGEPQNSVVAVSAGGSTKTPEGTKAFQYGFDAMMEILQPSQVLYFGKNVVSKRYEDRLIMVENTNMTRMHGEVTRRAKSKKKTREFLATRSESVQELIDHFRKEVERDVEA